MDNKNDNTVQNRLAYFPISFFAIILGLTGYSLAFQKAEEFFGFSFKISQYFVYATLALFAVVSILYLIKLFMFTEEVRKEWNHPVKMNFYPLLAKIFLVMSVILLEWKVDYSKYFWITGTILQFLFGIVIFSIWIRHEKFEVRHLNPAWFIPIVGNVIVPIAGIRHFHPDISWFFFSIGILLWLILFVIVIYRIFFHHPLPEKLIPTFFILFAPPAIAFISYVKLTGSLDSFARILYYFSLFIFLIVIVQFRLYFKIRFFLSWWAYSFPLAAITIATFFMYHLTHYAFMKIIALIFFSLLNLLMIVLVYLTVCAIKKQEICIEEEE